MKLKSETAKSLHVCKIVFSDFGRSLNRLSPKVIEDLDKYLSLRPCVGEQNPAYKYKLLYEKHLVQSRVFFISY